MAKRKAQDIHMARQEMLLSRIALDSGTGKPCIRGHRIWVSMILDLLASGMKTEQILAMYPGLEEQDVLACIAYAAELSKGLSVDLKPESSGDVS